MDHQAQSSPAQPSPSPVSPFRPAAPFTATTPPISGGLPQRQPSRLATNFSRATPDGIDTPSSLRAPGGGSVSSYSPRSFTDSPISVDSPKPLPFDMALQATPRPPQEATPIPSKKRYPLSGLSLDVSRAGGKNAPSSPSGNDYSPSMAVKPLNISRTISMDSSVSTSTSTTNQTGGGTNTEQYVPSAEDIARQIHTAGSAEAAIRRLLIETHTRSEESKKMYRLLTKQNETLKNMGASAKYYETEIARYRVERNNFRTERDELFKSVETLNAQIASHQDKRQLIASAKARSPAQSVDLGSQSHVGPDHSNIELNGADLTTPRNEHHFVPLPKHHRKNTTSTSGSDYTTEDDALPDIVSSNKRVTVIRAPPPPLNLIQEHPISPRLPKSPVFPQSPDFAASQGSFTAGRSTTHSQSSAPATPKPELIDLTTIQGRKGPPTPLKLGPNPPPRDLTEEKQRRPSTAGDVSDSDYDEDGNDGTTKSLSESSEQMRPDEVQEQRGVHERRGRRKTRAEDDADREEALARELEARSRSSKMLKASSSRSKHPPTINLPDTAIITPLSIEMNKLRTPPDESLVDNTPILEGRPPSKGPSLQPIQTVLVAPLPINAGLPLSPRPGHRLAMPGTLPQPRAPRDGAVLGTHSDMTVEQTTPLTAQSRSPIVNPKSPLRSSDGAQDGRASLNSGYLSPRMSPFTSAETAQSISAGSTDNADSEKTRTNSLEDITIPEDGIYKGLVSENYPDLLIGPNALPLIFIKVLQSRLKASRHSAIFLRGNDEEAIFTMGIFSRSSSVLLWKIEKPITTVVTLHTQLVKSSPGFAVQLPERSLFVGNAPAKVDARKAALENYLETMLDTPLTESGAVSVCRYLSSSVIVATTKEKPCNYASEQNASAGNESPDFVKEGFLTKRGKNFGGWKSRYFVLNDPVLKWYEAPGGSLQGSIKLEFSKVARLSGGSPGANEDPDGDSRHALVIYEPKKKDSKDVTKHVLCAESDKERDDWISAILYYVRPSPITSNESEVKNQAALSPPESSGKRTPKEERNPKSKRQDANMVNNSLENESVDSLQAIGYSATREGDAPTTVKPSTPHRSEFDNGQPLAAKLISGPTNGTVIRDPEAWNAMRPPDSPRTNVKEFKELRDNRKRSIWGFRDRNADSTASPTIDSPGTPKQNVKPVFGLPLSEAVEFCMAPGSTVCLPAVVYRCLEYLEEQGALSEEGIFRLSGSNLVVKQLRERFNTEGDVDLFRESTFYDVHAVASLLKQYLRELPSSVLSRELHVDFVRVLDFENLSDRVAGLNYLVHKLPLPNWTLLRALSAFMIGVVSNSAVNKMTMKNIGIVFVPTLNIPAPMLYLFLEEFNAIFEADPPEQLDIQRMTAKHTSVDTEKRRLTTDSSGGSIAAQMQSYLAMSTRDGSPLRPGSRGSLGEKGMSSKQRKRESNMLMMNMVHGLGLNSSPSRKDSFSAFHDS